MGIKEKGDHFDIFLHVGYLDVCKTYANGFIIYLVELYLWIIGDNS